jgi:poly-gamma-glutamate synthesis protein (capsule biosynthesis protein)
VGTDLVIGTHPHVIQPAVWYDRPDGGKMYCVYSLGNFVSNQHRRDTMLGGLLDMTLEFDANTGDLMQVKSAGIVPVVMHFQNSFKLQHAYLLEDYTTDLAAAHGIKKYTSPLTLEYLNKLADSVLGDQRRSWEDAND